jgi:Tfp pilus assembly protein PilN
MVSFGRKSAVAEAAPEELEVAPAAPVEIPLMKSLGAFPRANLIPDQIAAEAKVRTAKVALGLAAGGSVLLVAGLYLMATNEVNGAQDQLDSARAQSALLASEAAKYADVPRVRADLASAQSQQASALGGEVRWSTVLKNLGLTIPPGVSLLSLQGSVSGDAPTGTAAPGGPASVLGNPGIGSLQYSGEALDDARVASFLESVSKNTGVIDPFATQATSAESAGPGGPSSVSFTASATINSKALSHRYDVKGN